MVKKHYSDNNSSKVLRFLQLLFCIYAAVVAVCDTEAAEITFESLLSEMADFDMSARFPQPFYYCKQVSSYNRLAITPDDPEGWFSNGDNVGILRTEENQGRQERVLMDYAGPGVITRIWMPHMRPDHEKPPMDADTVIRFYLDGAKEPAIEAKVHDLITGRNFIKPPFAYISVNAGVVYLPIPFARGCKVTLDRDPFYYIINYRAYAGDADVKSFEMQQYDLARPVLGQVGRSLLSPSDFAHGRSAAMAERIASGAKKTVTMPAGPAAVRYLEVQVGGDVDPQVLRSTVLRMRFDGDETVWCPLGDFFGSGVGLNPFKGKYRQVSADGTLRCRWVMPYRRSAEVTIENLGEKTVNIKLRAVVGNWDWDGRSMYFHANWRYEYPLATRPRQDWNYIEARGRGVYMGDTLTVMNPVVGWWGEGDEKIWVDGDTFPSHFGTGTEDYYGYAWGGIGITFYERPFHAQVVAGANRTHGYNVQTRTRALDAIPFKEKIKLDMEVWHPREVETAYAVGTYWYGFGGTKSNRGAEPAQARQTIPQPPPVPPATERPRRGGAGPGLAQKVSGAIEFEDLKPAKVSKGIEVRERMVPALRWSGGKQLLINGTKAGDFIEFEIPAEGPGARKLIFHGTKGPRYGTCRISVNGKPAGDVLDLTYTKFEKTGPIELGVFEPEDGKFVLRFESVDLAPIKGSTKSIVGLDCIVFEKP